MARRSAASSKVIYAALAGNLLIAITKFIAAGLSGSAAMLSEGVHSLVDTLNEVLLIYGRWRSEAPPNRARPFGHGRELYFWSFMVALMIFLLGAGLSVYEGISHLRKPEPLQSLPIVWAVLGISAAIEATSWWIAMREFRKVKGKAGYFEAVRKSKDPSVFTVLFEDSAALLGLLVAFVGITAAHALHLPQLDGIASIAIGAILAVTAMFLARETKALLIGEPAHAHVQAAVLRIAGEDPAIEHANGVVTAQLGPDHVFAALSAEFHDRLTAPEIEACVNRIEGRIKDAYPEITALFVKPQSAKTWRSRRQALVDAGGER